MLKNSPSNIFYYLEDEIQKKKKKRELFFCQKGLIKILNAFVIFHFPPMVLLYLL